MMAPLRIHAETASAKARTLAGWSEAGSHGSAETSDLTQASATAGRPPRLGASTSFSPASRPRTMASTGPASLSAARRWPAPEGSTTRLAIQPRCDAAGNGHHQERLRQSGSTVRPGTTLPAATQCLGNVVDGIILGLEDHRRRLASHGAHHGRPRPVGREPLRPRR
jgi:hypothetical protein